MAGEERVKGRGKEGGRKLYGEEGSGKEGGRKLYGEE